MSFFKTTMGLMFLHVFFKSLSPLRPPIEALFHFLDAILMLCIKSTMPMCSWFSNITQNRTLIPFVLQTPKPTPLSSATTRYKFGIWETNANEAMSSFYPSRAFHISYWSIFYLSMVMAIAHYSFWRVTEWHIFPALNKFYNPASKLKTYSLN